MTTFKMNNNSSIINIKRNARMGKASFEEYMWLLDHTDKKNGMGLIQGILDTLPAINISNYEFLYNLVEGLYDKAWELSNHEESTKLEEVCYKVASFHEEYNEFTESNEELKERRIASMEAKMVEYLLNKEESFHKEFDCQEWSSRIYRGCQIQGAIECMFDNLWNEGGSVPEIEEAKVRAITKVVRKLGKYSYTASAVRREAECSAFVISECKGKNYFINSFREEEYLFSHDWVATFHKIQDSCDAVEGITVTDEEIKAAQEKWEATSWYKLCQLLK